METVTTPDTPNQAERAEEIGSISAEEEHRRRLVAEQVARVYGKKNPQFAPKPVTKPLPEGRRVTPVIPLWVTLASVALFVVLEARLFGWPYAVGIAAVIFIHECGHLAAVRKLKLPVIGIVLIPFLGGIAFSGRRGKTASEDAYVGILGPLYGLATGVAILALYFLTREPFFFALARIVFWMHLFNMTPIPPLDGSHVLAMLHKRKPGEYDPYYSRVTPRERYGYLALYVAVALFAAAGGWLLNRYGPVA